MTKPKPTGWDDMQGTSRAYHWFGADGRALCSRWANLSWNILLKDDEVHDDHKCKSCLKKRSKQMQAAE
jgi:hypothetical protein